MKRSGSFDSETMEMVQFGVSPSFPAETRSLRPLGFYKLVDPLNQPKGRHTHTCYIPLNRKNDPFMPLYILKAYQVDCKWNSYLSLDIPWLRVLPLVCGCLVFRAPPSKIPVFLLAFLQTQPTKRVPSPKRRRHFRVARLFAALPGFLLGGFGKP